MSADFSGNFAHTIDAKGRVTVPTAYRSCLGDRFTIGLNNQFSAIAIYPREKWERINEELNKIPDSDIRGMRYVRLINGNSFSNCELDAQGRILLPATLRQKTGILKSIRFVGVGQFFEIWDEEQYIRECEEAEATSDDLLSYINERYYQPTN